MAKKHHSYFKVIYSCLKENIFEIVFSIILALIIVLGYLLSVDTSIDVGLPSKALMVSVFFAFIVYFCIILVVLYCIKGIQVVSKKKSLLAKSMTSRRFWLVASLLIFLCYIPVILFSFSVLTPDSWSSIKQATGEQALTNAHPVIFTSLVWISLKIGDLVNNFHVGLLTYSLIQSMILAIIFGRVIAWLRDEKINEIFIAFTFIYFALLPINSIAGVIMWKDILFSGVGLLLIMQIRKLYLLKKDFFTKSNFLYFSVIGFLFCVWRNNGIYAYLVFVFLVCMFRRSLFFQKKYLLLLTTPIILFTLYSTAISFMAEGSPTEAMSVPLQQIARTVKYHGDSISTQDKDIINEVLPYEKLKEKYNPNLSDPVKNTLNYDKFSDNKLKYIEIWFNLLKENKRTYLAATIYNTYGYLYPFYPSTSPTDLISDNADQYNAKLGYKDVMFEKKYKQTLLSYNDILIQGFHILDNIGFYIFITIILLYLAITRRKHELEGVFLLLLSVFLSVILGPVNSEFRYLYLFVIAIPFLVGAVYLPKPNIKK